MLQKQASYADEMTKIGVKVSIKKVGLIISHSKPYLACSPDDFVEDESMEDLMGLLNINVHILPVS